jgi:CHASE2 domain-containing sensor protein
MNVEKMDRIRSSGEGVRYGSELLTAKAAANSKNILVDPSDADPGTEVFGTFLPETAFEKSHIGFAELANANPDAERQCRNRIVLIGGRWRGENGFGEPVDQHLSPAGNISGVALHATYIEALLAHQVSREWSFWTNFSFDILLGLGIYYGFEGIEDTRKKVRLLAFCGLLPVGVAWLSMAALNKYLDFLFPVELYFLHILVSTWERRLHRRVADAHVDCGGVSPPTG